MENEKKPRKYPGFFNNLNPAFAGFFFKPVFIYRNNIIFLVSVRNGLLSV